AAHRDEFQAREIEVVGESDGLSFEGFAEVHLHGDPVPFGGGAYRVDAFDLLDGRQRGFRDVDFFERRDGVPPYLDRVRVAAAHVGIQFAGREPDLDRNGPVAAGRHDGDERRVGFRAERYAVSAV